MAKQVLLSDGSSAISNAIATELQVDLINRADALVNAGIGQEGDAYLALIKAARTLDSKLKLSEKLRDLTPEGVSVLRLVQSAGKPSDYIGLATREFDQYEYEKVAEICNWIGSRKTPKKAPAKWFAKVAPKLIENDAISFNQIAALSDATDLQPSGIIKNNLRSTIKMMYQGDFRCFEKHQPERTILGVIWTPFARKLITGALLN